MTAEKIIQRIQSDAKKEVKRILKEAEKQAATIKATAKKEAQGEAQRILAEGKTQSENTRKILSAKASQDIKREIMNAQEKIIDECFTKAHHKLSTLPEKEYTKVVAKLIEDGSKRLGGTCGVMVSRDADRNIAKQLGLKVIGTVEVAGGVILKSPDGKITVDNTFDGIAKRKRDEIRIKVGKLLFSS